LTTYPFQVNVFVEQLRDCYIVTDSAPWNESPSRLGGLLVV